MHQRGQLASVVTDFEAERDGGGERELEALVEHFEHRVHFFARRVRMRFGLDPQWQDDLVSSGYWGLLQALRNRRPDAHAQELSAYVSTRVAGAVIDEARRVLARAASEAELDPDAMDSLRLGTSGATQWVREPGELGPEDLADRRARWASIARLVDHLRRDHQDLLFDYAQGRSISEIARREGLSPARLQNQMARITRQIRAHSPELRRLLRFEI